MEANQERTGAGLEVEDSQVSSRIFPARSRSSPSTHTFTDCGGTGRRLVAERG